MVGIKDIVDLNLLNIKWRVLYLLFLRIVFEIMVYCVKLMFFFCVFVKKDEKWLLYFCCNCVLFLFLISMNLVLFDFVVNLFILNNVWEYFVDVELMLLYRFLLEVNMIISFFGEVIDGLLLRSVVNGCYMLCDFLVLICIV